MAGGAASPSGAPRATPQKEAEFVPWSRFVSANEEVSKREAGELQSQVQGSVNAANKGRQDAQAAHTAAVGSNYVQPQKAGPTVFGKVQGDTSSFGQAPMAGAGGFAQQRAQTQAAAQAAPQTLPQATSAKGKAAAQNTADRQAPTLVGSDPNDAMRGAVDPNRINTDLSTGKPVSSAGDIAGAKDLEGQIGADAWSKLVGDTTKASEEAAALGSTSGVQALLGKQGNATAFDAALVGGAGSKGFQDLSKRWGGEGLSDALTGANKSAQGDWTRLMGDIDAAAGARDKEIGAATDEMNRLNDANAPIVDQQGRDADAAANRQELEDARTNFQKGLSAYGIDSLTPGAEPSVNSLGSVKDFLGALQSGATYGDKGQWIGSPSVKEQLDTASAALGISPEKLTEYFGKMNGTEWMDFWLLGVVPPWMEGVQSYGYGKPGGWKSPFLEGIAAYGDDGGMWNAITDMWKTSVVKGATAAFGGPAGVVTLGAEAVDKGVNN